MKGEIKCKLHAQNAARAKNRAVQARRPVYMWCAAKSDVRDKRTEVASENSVFSVDEDDTERGDSKWHDVIAMLTRASKFKFMRACSRKRHACRVRRARHGT
eukprot:IDg14546t1